MTHKQKCVGYCRETLASRSLLEYFSYTDFEHCYRKQNGAEANPYSMGLHAADYIIANAKKKTND